jgi:hypothetical protein
MYGNTREIFCNHVALFRAVSVCGREKGGREQSDKDLLKSNLTSVPKT